MPQVSVIIPTYNRAAFLPETISSVKNQSFTDLEIIVADDGSTDNTATIVQTFGTDITYLPLPHRGQPAATRNRGLLEARGEFIAFLDSDDLFWPDKLAVQAQALKANPDVGLVYSNGTFFRQEPAMITGRVLDGLPTPTGNAFPDLLRGNFLFPPVVLLRRVCIDQVGMFDENSDFYGVEDYEFWLRIAAKFPFLFVPGDVAAIRRHENSISSHFAIHKNRVLKVLHHIETLYPDLTQTYRQQLHEGYARNYGGLALAEMKQRRIFSALSCSRSAFCYMLRNPRVGIQAFIEWWKRRKQRQASRI